MMSQEIILKTYCPYCRQSDCYKECMDESELIIIKTNIAWSQRDENDEFDFEIVWNDETYSLINYRNHQVIDPSLHWQFTAEPYCGCDNCGGLSDYDFWELGTFDSGKIYNCWVWYCSYCLYLTVEIQG